MDAPRSVAVPRRTVMALPHLCRTLFSKWRQRPPWRDNEVGYAYTRIINGQGWARPRGFLILVAMHTVCGLVRSAGGSYDCSTKHPWWREARLGCYTYSSTPICEPGCVSLESRRVCSRVSCLQGLSRLCESASVHGRASRLRCTVQGSRSVAPCAVQQ